MRDRAGQTFRSILFERAEHRPGEDQDTAPACLGDLNLDQVIDAITAGREDYRLKPFFHVSLPSVEAITYRHEIFRDLEDRAVWKCIDAFARTMRSMREHLAQAEKLYYEYKK